MNSKKTCILVAAFAVSFTLSSTADAQNPMYFDFLGEAAVQTTYLNDPGLGINNLDVYVGQYNAELSPNSDFSNATTYETFCVDLKDQVTNGQQYLVDLFSTNNGLTNGEQIAYLYTTYGLNSIADSNYAAALQLAIWDELANNGQGQFSVGATLTYSLTDPSSPDYNATVAGYLSTFLTAANASSGAEAQWLDSNVNVPEPFGWTQGQGFLAPFGMGPNVPEPGSIALLAIGAASLATVGAIRRRRHR